MGVDIRIILADLAHERFSALLCRREEDFFGLEDLLLHLIGSLDVKLVRQSDEQELLVMSLGSGQANSLEYSVDTFSDLSIKTVLVQVVNDSELWMADP